MTLGAKAERHNPAAAITEPGDDDVDHEYHYRVGPCEKVSENIDPFENHFFVINYQHWTGTSALQ